MPSIDEFSLKSPSKKFKKTSYRPWTIIDSENNNSTDHLEKSIDDITTESPTFKNQKFLKEKTINSHRNLNTDYEPVGNQSVTNCKPTEYHNIITKEPIENQLDIRSQIDYQLVNNLIGNQNTVCPIKKTGADFKETWSLEKATYELSRLCGLQRKIVFYIGTNCMAKNDLFSGPICINDLKLLLETDADTIKTATQRLVHKGFIARETGKKGTGGFSLFRIQESLKQAILQDIKFSQTSSGLVTKLEPKREPRNNSSSNYNTSITTNLSSNENGLLTEWQEIDISSLENIGFSKAHLIQIVKFGLLDPEIVQDSINAFAFDIEVNGKAQKLRTTPLNYFMGIMKNGMPYAPPENYETSEERALKIYIEKKKIEQKRKEELEKEAFNLSFSDWVHTLTEEEVCKIIPKANYREKGSPFRTASLELHFRDNLWADTKKQIIIES